MSEEAVSHVMITWEPWPFCLEKKKRKSGSLEPLI